MLKFLPVVFCVVGMWSDASATEPVPTINHADVFDTMKSLAGSYKELGEDAPADIEYQLIARGTALVETWHMSSGGVEMSVFHMDKDTLVATHYCAAGMQSTMQLTSVSDDGVYNFRLRSISNLADESAPHNSGFGYRFESRGTVYRDEIWTTDGADSVSDLKMRRVQE